MLKEHKAIFEESKSQFKALYNQDWNKDPLLYSHYLQTIYLRTIYGILESGLNGLHIDQLEAIRAINSVRQAISDGKKN